MKLMRIEQAIVAAAKNIYNVFLDDIVTGDFDPPIAKWRMNTKFGIFQSRYEVHSQPTRIVMEVDLNLFCQASARNLLSRALVDLRSLKPKIGRYEIKRNGDVYYKLDFYCTEEEAENEKTYKSLWKMLENMFAPDSEAYPMLSAFASGNIPGGVFLCEEGDVYTGRRVDGRPDGFGDFKKDVSSFWDILERNAADDDDYAEDDTDDGDDDDSDEDCDEDEGDKKPDGSDADKKNEDKKKEDEGNKDEKDFDEVFPDDED